MQQRRVVVGHLLEVGDDPALVHGVAVEPAAQVIVNPPSGHAGERLLHDVPRPGLALVVPAAEEELYGAGRGELRGGAEATVPDVEQARHLARRLRDRVGRDLAALRLVQRLGDVLANGFRVARRFGAVLAVQPGHVARHREEAGAAVRVVLGRKVRPAEEHVTVGGEERGERPAALAGERLHRALVARVHVRALVAIHLDADEVAVQEFREVPVLVRLTVHHVAPVTPHSADVEEDRLVLAPGAGECCLPPRVPVHGLMGGGLKVG